MLRALEGGHAFERAAIPLSTPKPEVKNRLAGLAVELLISAVLEQLAPAPSNHGSVTVAVGERTSVQTLRP